MEKDILKELLYNTILDECKVRNISKPDFITEEEWFTAFDVLEAHYLANNKMEEYMNDIENYIRKVILWYSAEPMWAARTLLAGASIAATESIEDEQELCAIAEEIFDRIMKLPRNIKQLRK